MSDIDSRVLNPTEARLVELVEEEVGRIPAASLEMVLKQGSQAERFQGINLVQLYKIVRLAEVAGIELPTQEL